MSDAPTNSRDQGMTEIDDALKSILHSYQEGPTKGLGDMLAYFFGFLNTDLKPTITAGGKRFRPALTLMIADAYGTRKTAFDAAIAIELFHNFTLIHDDIEDRDEFRRGRPTVWKLFGIEHAINAGDLLAHIAYTAAAKAETKDILLSAFAEVIQGQYMDIELTNPSDEKSISIATYMTMIEKKTGALMGAAAQSAGPRSAQNTDETAYLRLLGRELGIAFQLHDDYLSIWSDETRTGKDLHSDIREHKRTLPYLIAIEESSRKDRLRDLYLLNRQLTPSEISEAKMIIEATDARERTHQAITAHTKAVLSTIESLTLPTLKRESLTRIVEPLEAL